MKRSALKRSTKPLRARAPLRRRKQIERSPMRRKLPRRLARRAHLDAHGDYVRTMDCCSCRRSATPDVPNAAAHITLSRNQKGMGMKVPDEQRVALCDGPEGCHGQWDQHRGKFAGWSDELRYELGALWVGATLARWEAERLTRELEAMEDDAS